jgi:hypothetical protein
MLLGLSPKEENINGGYLGIDEEETGNGENYVMSDFVISENYSSVRIPKLAGDENNWRCWLVGIVWRT